MKTEDKLNLLSSSIKKHLSLKSGTIITHTYTLHEGESRIQACFTCSTDWQQELADEKFNENWSLNEWKEFRNKCVEKFRGL